MKRMTALVLAALLILAGVSAWAEGYTLQEKFYRQAFQESAYKGTVTFTAEGSGTSVIAPSVWTALRSLAPRLSLAFDHTTTRERDEGQASLTVTLNGAESSRTVFSYDDKLMGISSTLFGSGNILYTAARNWDLTRLFQSLIKDGSVWPPVWRMLLAAQNASQEWKTRAAERLAVYETKVGIWLNGYAAYSTGRENGAAYSQLACTIPAQAVKAEIQQLLVDFYNDSDLLTLLREIATPQEASAYLQPGMRDTIFSMLDALDLKGEVEVVRRFDAKGGAMLDKVTMPFAEGSRISSLTVSMYPETGGQCRRAVGTLSDGTEFDVSCVAGEDMIFTGSVELVLPKESETASFVVSEAAPERKSVAFDYSLTWEPDEEVYTLSTDRSTQNIKGALLIRPRAGSELPEQALTLDATFSSASSQRAATYLNGTLAWRDLDGEASITAVLSSKTAAPFAYNTPSSQSSAIRIDLMTQESRGVLVKTWMERIQSYAVSTLMGGLGLLNSPASKP